MDRESWGGRFTRARSVNIDRLNRGDAVGEDWIFGQRADELVASGAVSQETMTRYRDGLLLQFREVYGQKAEAMIAERRAQRLTIEPDADLRHWCETDAPDVPR